jgi:CRISPR-associated protein Cas2
MLMISPYKTMWIVTAFDLPTLTKKDRRIANNFRKDLLKIGFCQRRLEIAGFRRFNFAGYMQKNN